MLAKWLTRPDNPYFARATVNRVWAYFFGTGLIDPVDEESEDNPPSHPELLNELAREFADHGHDLKFLIRAIVASRTYQLSSVRTDPTQDDPRLFARMAVRGLSPEQLFDSVALIFGYNEPRPDPQPSNYTNRNPPRAQFLAQFSGEAGSRKAETSIQQALFMMNGKLMTEAASCKHNKMLAHIAGSSLPTAKRIEQLYLIVLGRKPTPRESARMVRYVKKGGGSGDPKKAFEDVFWALLNSGEFMLNH